MNLSFVDLRNQFTRIADQEIPGRLQTGASALKRDGSPVTETDLVMQRRLKELLSAVAPEFGFLGEEMSAEEQAVQLAQADTGVWVLDPLDGTSNFAAGMPFCAVSLALVVGGWTEFGLVYDPLRGECFHARRGQGAWLGDQRLEPRKAPRRLRQCIGLVDFKRLPPDLAVRLAADPPYGSQRNLGSVALELCWLAAGRGHLYLHGGQKLWDHAAALLVLDEAGGSAVTLEGDRSPAPSLGPRSTVAALDSGLFAQWVDWLGVQPA